MQYKNTIKIIGFLTIGLVFSLYCQKNQDGGVAWANSPQTVQLKQSVTITGDNIKLSDIFTNIPEMLDKDVLKAPPPGEEIVIPAQWLQQQAYEHRLNWRALSASSQARVKRLSKIIYAEEVLDHVRAEFFHQYGNEYSPDLTDIKFSTIHRDIHLPLDDEMNIHMARLDFNARTGMLSATVRVGANDLAKKLMIRARIQRLVEAWAPTTRLSRGHIIGENDLQLITVPIRTLNNDAVLDADDIIGKEVVQSLQNDKPILTRQIRPPLLVKKKDIVALILQKPGLRLSTRGISLDHGAKNDIIRVKNLQSQIVIEATVINKGVAIVESNAIMQNAPHASLKDSNIIQ